MKLVSKDDLLKLVDELMLSDNDYGMIVDLIDKLPVIADIPVDEKLKNPHLEKRKGLIELDYLTYRVNEGLPEKLSDDAQYMMDCIYDSPEVDKVYTMGGYYGEDSFFKLDKK